ncbi:MAG: phosphoenolpyruvate--protein phosphotransferase, partial [Gammaproteobacteria bacterium]|nr:phosphoenolpyruvate--protein phosphotransferase [Gammaproteobacteria bacterium]
MTYARLGTGISSGVVIGPVRILYRNELEIPQCSLPPQFIAEEIARYQAALTGAKQHLKDIRGQIPAHTPADIVEFIDTHLLMLDDSTLSRVPIEIISSRECNAEWALKLQRDSLVRVFDEMEDPYLRTRRDDVDHVVNTIMRILLNSPVHHSVKPSQESTYSGYVLVTDELSPADAILMQHQGIAAFITEGGGPTSHTAILARSLGIPAVVGLHHARHCYQNDETVILDGQRGWVIGTPDAHTLTHFHQQRRREQNRFIETIRNRHQPAVTRDGINISVLANIEMPGDIESANRIGAQGVGLFRTEYLYMNRLLPPSEEEQFEIYRETLQRLAGKPLTIRTLDLGADKQINNSSTQTTVPVNPALGLRAIRLALKEPDLFLPQLRAILRVSALGPVKILLPMISNVQELQLILRLLQDTCHALQTQGLAFDPNIPVGGMIEVPAAAINADMFLNFLDFLSIGTNDLIQYTLAIDRVDDEVNYLYDPLNPAVLQLINITLMAGRKFGKPVSMCGEMAGDPRFTRLLLGLGLTEFSMH